MIRYIILVCLILSLIGCEKGNPPQFVEDQTLRVKLFDKCMEQAAKLTHSLPSYGATDVIEECDDMSRSQARKCIMNCRGYVIYTMICPVPPTGLFLLGLYLIFER